MKKTEAVFFVTMLLMRHGGSKLALSGSQLDAFDTEAKMVVLIVLIALAVLYLFLVFPRLGKDMSAFMGRTYAHRGLHDNASFAPENSLSAFSAACAQGYGIELDVRLSKDGVLVVFHDDTLERACGDKRRVEDVTMSQLREFRLFGSDQQIPTFDEALQCIEGRVPLIVEIKTEKRFRQSTRKAVESLQAYSGQYCVESFHPFVLRELRKIAPQIVRGQLAACLHDSADTVGGIVGFLLSSLLLNAVSRPDFVAYDIKGYKSWTLRLQRSLFRTKIALWTIRSGRDAEHSYKGDMIISEWFR